MPNLDQLNEQFAIADAARFDGGRGGLARLTITTPAVSGEIYLHGAHVTNFQPAGQKPVLFVSDQSEFAAGKAIRGGVPVIFPWFGPHKQDPARMHGLVRTRPWNVREVARTVEGGVRAVLGIVSDVETRTIWPNDFDLTFAATFGSMLKMELTVKNTSSSAWTFEEALHTYFSVGDVQRIAIDGLAATDYVEKFIGPDRRRQEPKTLIPAGPTDRVYLDTQSACVIHDRANNRRITVAKENSHSTVVWNPWSDAIAKFADLDSLAWTRFVCVETCNVWGHAPQLAPGDSHVLRAIISVQSG